MKKQPKEWEKISANHISDMGLTSKYLRKSHTEKDKYHMISHMWNLKRMIQMNSFTKQKWTHRHRKQTYGYQSLGRDQLGIWD